MTDQLHPMTPHHLPFYIVKPGETDVLLIVMGIFLIFAVLGIGLQFEIVAVLGLISLFTHIHIFWIGGLLLALIDLPDFSTPLSRIAGSVEKIADAEDLASGTAAEGLSAARNAAARDRAEPASQQPSARTREVGNHV